MCCRARAPALPTRSRPALSAGINGKQAHHLGMSSSRPSSPSKRREMDVLKLIMRDYKVKLVDENPADFHVIFHGPKDSPYHGGSWKVHVELPEGYPYKSPSIGFCNRMFHPNVDEMSGSVCLDVINQTWSPMFDLVNIFEVFLPQLLLYPNASDPLNGEAAALLMRQPERYQQRVAEYVQQYGRAELPGEESEGEDDEEEEEDDD